MNHNYVIIFVLLVLQVNNNKDLSTAASEISVIKNMTLRAQQQQFTFMYHELHAMIVAHVMLMAV